MIRQIDLAEWHDFASAQNNFQIYHQQNWLRLLAEQYGFEPKIYAALEGGEIRTAIPFLVTRTILGKKKLVSLPFSDYLGLINPGEGQLEELLHFLKQEQSRQYRLIEIRSSLPKQELYREDLFVQHRLDLNGGYEKLAHNFKDSIRRNIKKAEKSKLRIDFSSSDEAVEVFYRLHLLTRRKHGAPIQPKGYFYRLKKYLFDKQLGFVAIAYLDTQPLAAAIFLHTRQKLVYKYGASDERYLAYRPNELLFSAVIKWGCEQRYESLDFGISYNYNEGLRRYKSNWGATEEAAPYYFITSRVPTKGIIRGENRYLKWVVRNSPGWVCRILGESLYRFAG